MNTKANALRDLHRISEAIDCLMEANRLHPNKPSVCNNLGNLHLALADIQGALHWYQKAHQSNPRDPLAFSNITSTLHYHPDFDLDEIHRTCLAWNQFFGQPPKEWKATSALPNSEQVRPLKIGFLSDGFRRHPVGYMVTATLENLPEDQFELVAYTTNDYEDDITKTHHAVWSTNGCLSLAFLRKS